MALRVKNLVSDRTYSTALTTIDTLATGTNASPGFEGRFGNKASVRIHPSANQNGSLGIYSCASTATDAAATALVTTTTASTVPTVTEITIPRYLGVKNATTHSTGSFTVWLEA